ncbi:MAG: helix-turn-helix domain-containing protein [Mesorhizobium sp.]|uniref:hypothetical protein n=1 Tax=Mesorhizobium sp. TaxID=1871066 RepID=UPI000FE75779|nr:hypothetical protein [Mesorhizobium sp.]RWB40313.1 MAG: DNA-binding protein [Mesorhizobium sp.]RWB57878.1 MAG: DNA-binding protein [Mesorhizobium sp.]RWB72953.1 MAG: DNA-binding protein [Mesorhizobium sp.]RWB82102.1 MAG: DNA-binding protein [Mesorhizobium sp.]RWD75836.1 MAG: DNA-binding protein [Mesorhizobium sp.]
MQTPAPKPFYTISDLIGFGFSNGHIYNEIKSGRLIVRKSGRRSIISHDELMAYINSLPMSGNVAA